jgi:hypothetical protein
MSLDSDKGSVCSRESARHKQDHVSVYEGKFSLVWVTKASSLAWLLNL